MELYARNPGREGSESDAPADWGETGLEESMWRLGLTGTESYPERPDVLDCVYYMRTGICGYGSRCRYNHPPDRAAAAAAIRLVGGVYPERPGQPTCQYYLKTGTCKFGTTCKFHHPRNAGGSLSNIPLNYQGYPLRENEKECSYYLKTGQCKFGVTCKFHHPRTAGVSVTAPAFYPPAQSLSVPHPEQIAGSSTSYGVARPTLLPSSYVPGAYGPVLLSPGVVPVPGWTSYSGPVSPVLSPGAQASTGSVYGVTQLSSSPSAVAVPYQLQSTDGLSGSNVTEAIFPERPGQLECQFYLKTGDCKYGSSCRYHHPPDRAASIAPCFLSPLGLPLRPETQACSFYMQNGYCKFGRTCKFDHPMGAPLMHSPSSSSVSEMPVAPYMASPLLRSASSPSDFFLDYASAGPASGSVGFPFSQTWPVSLPNVHRQGQDSASSSNRCR